MTRIEQIREELERSYALDPQTKVELRRGLNIRRTRGMNAQSNGTIRIWALGIHRSRVDCVYPSPEPPQDLPGKGTSAAAMGITGGPQLPRLSFAAYFGECLPQTNHAPAELFGIRLFLLASVS
jgi:hypothetical protein